MIACDLSNIRAIYNFPDAYTVNEDGTLEDLVLTGAPKTYQQEFVEFYCIKHDCAFKQWKSAEFHITGTADD